MNPAIKAAKARVAREQQIQILKICTCNYPLDRFRNISGHSGECPAHVLYMQIFHDSDD